MFLQSTNANLKHCLIGTLNAFNKNFLNFYKHFVILTFVFTVARSGKLACYMYFFYQVLYRTQNDLFSIASLDSGYLQIHIEHLFDFNIAI